MVMQRNLFNVLHIFIEDFEAEAEQFLRKQKCEDAIENPQRVPIEMIAAQMSLDVIDDECLSEDGSVSGAIAFTDGVIDVYDWSSEGYIGYHVDRPSVFIDAGITSDGHKRNTLAHECFHWYKHRLYFAYKRSHENSTEFAIRCDQRLVVNDSNTWTDVERMEWQARKMAPKILMPRKAAQKKLDELIQKSRGFRNRVEATELMVKEFADCFGVSEQSAAIRMVELGFNDAEPYCNGNAYPGFERTQTYSKAKKRHQPITLDAAFELYTKNDLLRSLIDTGCFCYADGYFVLKKKEYVVRYGDEYRLTQYARAHLAECTIDITAKIVSELSWAAPSMLYSSAINWVEQKEVNNSAQNVDLLTVAKTMDDLEDGFEADLARMKSMSYEDKSGTEIMWDYVQKAGWKGKDFVNATELGYSDFTKLQKNHPFGLESFMAMAVGLGLTLPETEKVLHASNLGFIENRNNPDYRRHFAYKYILSVMHPCDILTCNEFLEGRGLPPLGQHARR